MNFELKEENGEVLILLNTRLDSTSAAEFGEVLKKQLPAVKQSMLLDFTNVDFISSIGLRVLVSVYRELNAAGKELVIRNANSSVKEIMKLSGLLKIFRFE